MSEAEDAVLGKIAIQMGLITPGQLQQLLALSKQFGKPVGALLTQHHAISSVDMQKLIELRKIGVRSEDPAPPGLQDTIVFARALVRQGLVTEEQADECLRDLVIEGMKRPLPDLLVERGLLPLDKAREVQALVERRAMHCAKCRINFQVRSASGRKTIDCPRCKQPLAEGRLPITTRVTSPVEFTTTVMRTIDPAGTSPPPAKDAAVVDVQCIICDALFKAALDPAGRVKCPQCGSSFTPR